MSLSSLLWTLSRICITDANWFSFPFMSHLQENLIHDDNKLILLASLSDSLEYVADSIERQVHLIRAINVCFSILFVCCMNKQ
jgi:hypothetical protein